ncbi:hypothetical protein [Pseudogracilibacillus sp. SO30301A]|uniref:hypothetical protein n=1 Tax=Pseudogracilibacillus sp. SO30301A TaxID=3098291 RepID=UPI00300E4CF2
MAKTTIPIGDVTNAKTAPNAVVAPVAIIVTVVHNVDAPVMSLNAPVPIIARVLQIYLRASKF